MKHEIATTILKNVGILSCIFWILLFFGFITESSNGNLVGDALAISIILLIFCVSCIGGLCVITNPFPKHIMTIGLIITCVSVFALQLSLVVVNFIEWVDPECEKDILALCTAGKENFLAMICISTVLHSAFLAFWKSLYVYIKNKPKLKTYTMQPQETEHDNDSIAVHLTGSEGDNIEEKEFNDF